MGRDLKRCLQRCAAELSCFVRARRGAMAVEFALVAPIFIATLVAVLQTSVFVFAQQALQNAATEAGRLFMTGQAQNSGMTQQQLINAVCPTISALFDCNKVIVIVQNYADFAAANTSEPQLYNSQGQLNTNWAYDPGTPGEVMVVQLVYQWPVVSAPLGFTLANLPNGAAEMMGVSAFRVEPYGGGNAGNAGNGSNNCIDGNGPNNCNGTGSGGSNGGGANTGGGPPGGGGGSGGGSGTGGSGWGGGGWGDGGGGRGDDGGGRGDDGGG